MRKCDSCGKIYQESKDVFCPHCGAVAEKQCTHSSSFDSKRYDRGEIYKNNTQYQNTTYKQGFEPHAQRESTPYNTSVNNSGFGDKVPQINLPDFKRVFSKGNGQNGKLIGAIVACVIIGLNLITGVLSTNDVISSDYEMVTEYEEEVNELYTVVDEATIEMIDTTGDFKTFTLEIQGMGFDAFLPTYIQDDIINGIMTEDIISEGTFVKMLICDFSKTVVNEESYNNALEDCHYYTGKQVKNKCKYEFVYNFDFDEIVHIAGGVNFHLGNGLLVNAELPFSAFSVSENGEITYYTSYADSGTAWNTVFSECLNKQEIGEDLSIDFNEVEYGE